MVFTKPAYYYAYRQLAIENLHKKRLAVEAMIMSVRPTLLVDSMFEEMLKEQRKKLNEHIDAMIMRGIG